MDDGPRGIEVFHDHFQASTSGSDTRTSSLTDSQTDINPRPGGRLWSRVQLKRAASMLNLFSLRGLPWAANGQEKVVLTAADVASLRSEIADLEEREAHLKAQLEHIDEVLRSARLSGYLHMRMRWATLPGELPPLDDTEVDDWLPRFFVLQGSCIFLYVVSTDLSPQDSTLLCDVVEVGPLPNLTREDEEVRYCFFILTRQGLRYECSSASKVQADSWLEALQEHCKTGPQSKSPGDLKDIGGKSVNSLEQGSIASYHL